MGELRRLRDYRPLLRFVCWRLDRFGQPGSRQTFAGHVELVTSEHEAAETAAWLLFDRASARRAAQGEYIAYGARVPEASPRGYAPEEIRFMLKEER
jgi:hypothetical protein